MTRNLYRLAVLVVAAWLGAGAVAQAATPLVDVAWLKENAARDDVVVLDVRNKLSGGTEESYRAAHIPGAVYSDYLNAGWRTTVDGVPGQLPPVADLERLIGGLGIDNDTHVVIVSGGTSALDMGSATRVYWTFKVLGHDAVSILDGGYRAYAEDTANPTKSGWRAPVAKTFEADVRPELVANAEEVAAARASGAALIDARPPAQYRGEQKHGAAKRPGTIPGAANVPESTLTTESGRFVDAARVSALLESVGVKPDAEAVAFCNTGHWASLAWFAQSEILGNKKVRVYDGSMVDWSARDELPIERKQ